MKFDGSDSVLRSFDTVIGYTTGVYDLFHIGHLNLLKNAKSMCDHLIVGVSTDELVQEAKNKSPVIPFAERLEIVSSVKYVDTAVRQSDYDKLAAWERYKFNIMFVGDDWKDSLKWKSIENEFKNFGVKIIYFPYTLNTSSTKINNILDNFK
jgi:glycerol-3-phosphate cytidylyltransferase